ncbi:MAG TPA: hypothetical protein VEP90_20285 [Methylomirabilota bacterium]|nr:hypothetical protein [Methylomirabilota bacterium]
MNGQPLHSIMPTMIISTAVDYQDYLDGKVKIIGQYRWIPPNIWGFKEKW